MKKRLAIVSSYSESCGNAAFTRVLHDSIEKFGDVDVEVVELDLQLLQSGSRSVRKKADKHIDEMCKTLAGFDAVNLQLEAGLYGTVPSDITSRVRRLVNSNKVMSVTMHSPRLKASSNYGFREGIKNLTRLKIGTGLSQIIGELRGNVHVNINRQIIKDCAAKDHRLIVHTKRAAGQIKVFFDYENSSIHPLKIVPDDFAPDKSILEGMRKELGLKSTDKVIGIFGYISAYKGHLDALDAMKKLPEDYKLLIFGRQHPQTLKSDGQIDEYISRLKAVILSDEKDKQKYDLSMARISNKEPQKTTSLAERVFFMGELSDPDFLNVAGSVDVAWLPYYENGQDGSGIASICFDACPKVVCSASFAFDQLFRLVKYKNTTRFDIGNSLELASRTKQILKRKSVSRPFAESDIYSLKSQAKTYLMDLED